MSLTEILNAISSRITPLEVRPRQQTLLLQHLLTALANNDEDGSCELPDGMELPLKSLRELRNLEASLEDEEKSKQLVAILHIN